MKVEWIISAKISIFTFEGYIKGIKPYFIASNTGKPNPSIVDG